MSTNNVGRVLVSLIVVIGFMMTTYIFLTTKAMGATPSETLTLLVGALASNFTSVVSYWIGSSSGSTAKDEQLSKTAERLAEKVPVAHGTAVAPKPIRWANMTDAEKTTIAGAGSSDTRIAKFMVDAQDGGATFDELDYLVSKGIVTAERAEEIKKASVVT